MLLVAQIGTYSPARLASADVGITVRFWPLTRWSNNYSDPLGCNSDPSFWGTIRFPDVNGDGTADVCGRGGIGIVCGVSNGTSFSSPKQSSSGLSGLGEIQL